MLGITTTNARVGGFRGGIDADAKAIYNRIIAIPNGFSNLSRLNYFVKGLKAIYGTLSNVPVCYDAHWIGGVLGSGAGATAGQACARLCSLTVAGDAVQATASAQPLLLMHGGAASDNYWYGSGVSGNYCSTPNAAANQITGDIEIIVNLNFDSLTGSSYSTIIDKSLATNYQYYLTYNNTTGILIYTYTIGSTIQLFSTTNLLSAGITSRTYFWIKVTRNSANGDVKFYTSLDSRNIAPSLVVFTQLGATISGTSGNTPAVVAPVLLGEYRGAEVLKGKISRLTISNSIGGAPVVDFNPATYNASTSQTAWTSSTGEVWTINKASSLTLQGSLVDRTQVIGNGSSYFMTNLETGLRPASNTQYVTYLNAFNDGGGNRQVIDSNSNNWYNSIEAGGPFVNLYMNGAVSSIATSKSIKSLDLIVTSTNAGVQNAIRKNNGASTTNTYSPTPSGNGLTLFSRFGGTFASAVILNTYVCVNGADSDATKTATYNFIRSLNNNAF
jgi:hypothetical protein